MNLEGLKSVFSKRCASKIWWGVSEVRFKKTRLIHLGNVEKPPHPHFSAQRAPEVKDISNERPVKFYSIFNISGSFFFRLIYFGGSHSAAVFEDIDKRFFATDRKMVNLVNSRDGFFNFDSRLKIFSDM